MKNKKLIFAVLFAGILALNTLVLSTTNNNDIQLNSLFTLASAQAQEGEEDIEIAEVTITCGQEEGPCWDGECETVGTGFGPTRVMVCDDFMGQIMYNCVNDFPCW